MTANSTSSPFTRAVVSSMRKLYPEALADKSFDNTGLLLEAPFNPRRRQRNAVLLTIDLTRKVADEAIKQRVSTIVAYHPIIFRGLKSLTLDDSQQHSLLRLAQEGISVYSPHTAVDSIPGGMGDWLCDIVSGDPVLSASSSSERQAVECQSELYSRPTYPTPLESSPSQSPTAPHTRTTILPSPSPVPEGFESAGTGRLVTFNAPQPLTSLVDRIARNVGLPGGVPIAIPQGAWVDDLRIRTVGVCPGSGSSVLIKGTGEKLPDLLLTGELSHHEALAVTERGSVVIALSHSNTERGYLHGVMKDKLAGTLQEVWRDECTQGLKAIEESAKQGGAGVEEGVEGALRDTECQVEVSQEDRDPFGIMVRM